jgi:chaperone BCS1
MTDRHIVTISLKLIKTKKQLDSIFFEQRYNSCNEKNSIGFEKKIIVFEDIDCIGDIVMSRELRKQHTEPIQIKALELKATDLIKLEPNDEPITLDDLLNLWDGIRETPSRIMVLSSNHFDKLDPAIKRPGRIDISLELSYASLQTIAEMYNHLFDEHLDAEILKNIPDKFYSPAEIVNIYMSEERSSTKFLSRMMQNKHV